MPKYFLLKMNLRRFDFASIVRMWSKNFVPRAIETILIQEESIHTREKRSEYFSKLNRQAKGGSKSVRESLIVPFTIKWKLMGFWIF